MNGIDISHHQRILDISKITCDFVIIKATQGVRHVDDCWERFYSQALSLGKKIGLYHYFGGGDPVEEADHFLRVVSDCVGKAIFVLDWEKYQNQKFSKGETVAKPFLDRVFEKTGVKPLIYMSKSVCRERDWSCVAAAGYELWMAQYANKNPTGYRESPWTDSKSIGAFNGWMIHQYTSNGFLDGYAGSIDLDISYMDAETWDYMAKPHKGKFYPLPKIQTLFQASGIPHTYQEREIIAHKNGLIEYSGKVEENMYLIGLWAQGKLLIP